MSGYVYVLTNPAMPGLVKIGMTKVTPIVRARQLYTTGVPKPFVVHTSLKVSNPRLVEQRAHQRLEKYRINGSREFFKLSPERARGILYYYAGRKQQAKKWLHMK